MSLDSVDDVQAAEEALAAAGIDFCRPTCIDQAEHWGGCIDEAECGCLCHGKDGGCEICGQTGYREDA